MLASVANTGINGWSGWLASLAPTEATVATKVAVAIAGVLLFVTPSTNVLAVGSVAQRPVLVDAPATLAETGLYSDWSSKTIAPDLLPFSPQYPLWSDGATKQRWIYLPAAIDATGAWRFPVGTRIWKQFSFGERVETRFMALTQRGWTYATYVWHGDVAVRSDGETVGSHRVPTTGDCRACHGNAASPVLGFAPLQLSVDRDPNAPHRERAGVDLLSLTIAGYLDGVTEVAPRIPGSPTQRAALGYLHGNCGGCHRNEGPLAGLAMNFAEPERVLATTSNITAKFLPKPRLAPGDASHSLLVERMSARQSPAQMPPIGTDLVDADALRIVSNWIDQTH
jgi:mono/diheme cytochrome c family protein